VTGKFAFHCPLADGAFLGVAFFIGNRCRSAVTLIFVRKKVYLSLGSNQGDRVANLRAAIAALAMLGKVAAVSSFYETEPVEFTQQPWFVNCAVALETELMPKQLLGAVLKIEREMGRRRIANQIKGPRPIDIDILLFGASVIDTPNLQIPHPAMHHRRFVLQPLAEIACEERHPVLNKTIRELRDALPSGQAVRKLQAPFPSPGKKA
jgi:2-amino-4-hydroxy-6-hydroxymethyldihydropteridine diphosphokinase